MVSYKPAQTVRISFFVLPVPKVRTSAKSTTLRLRADKICLSLALRLSGPVLLPNEGGDEALTPLCVEGSTVSVAIGMARGHVSRTIGGSRRKRRRNSWVWGYVKTRKQDENGMT